MTASTFSLYMYSWSENNLKNGPFYRWILTAVLLPLDQGLQPNVSDFVAKISVVIYVCIASD